MGWQEPRFDREAPDDGRARVHDLDSGMKSESSSDPAVHSRNIQDQLQELIDHARADVGKVTEPRFQALLETTAEVLEGLKTAFSHYDQKREPAWGGRAK